MELEDLYTATRHQEGAEMRVKDQFGKDTDFYIKLVGVDSATWAKIQRDFNRDLLAMGKNDKSVDDKEVQVRMISQAIIGWRGFTNKGKAVKFSTKKAEELLKNAPYVADQADRFIAKRLNFTKG